MNNLEKAKEIVKQAIKDHGVGLGIFNTRNILGDKMTTIYKDKELKVDMCYDWEYLEVFGLTEDEFIELADFYYGEIEND